MTYDASKDPGYEAYNKALDRAFDRFQKGKRVSMSDCKDILEYMHFLLTAGKNGPVPQNIWDTFMGFLHYECGMDDDESETSVVAEPAPAQLKFNFDPQN